MINVLNVTKSCKPACLISSMTPWAALRSRSTRLRSFKYRLRVAKVLLCGALADHGDELREVRRRVVEKRPCEFRAAASDGGVHKAPLKAWVHEDRAARGVGKGGDVRLVDDARLLGLVLVGLEANQGRNDVELLILKMLAELVCHRHVPSLTT